MGQMKIVQIMVYRMRMRASDPRIIMCVILYLNKQFQMARPHYEFVEYLLYNPIALANQHTLYSSRQPGTWKAHVKVGKALFAKARILGISFFPLQADTLSLLLGALDDPKWTARFWKNVSGYLSIVATLNRFTLPPDIQLLLQGKQKENIVTIEPRRERPLVDPQQFKELMFKIKSLPRSFYRERTILAIALGYYTGIHFIKMAGHWVKNCSWKILRFVSLEGTACAHNTRQDSDQFSHKEKFEARP